MHWFRPQTPLGELTTLPQSILVGWRGVRLPIPFLPLRFRRLDLVSVPTAPWFLGPTDKKKFLDTSTLLRRRGPE